MDSDNTYLVETGGKTWASKGKDMNEGVLNAFKQIRDDCYEQKTNLKIDLTFTVRREGEPKRLGIEGNTLKMLQAIGELKEVDVDTLTRMFGGKGGK